MSDSESIVVNSGTEFPLLMVILLVELRRAFSQKCCMNIRGSFGVPSFEDICVSRPAFQTFTTFIMASAVRLPRESRPCLRFWSRYIQ